MQINKITELAKAKGIEEIKLIGGELKTSTLQWENGKIENVVASSKESLQLFGTINKNEASLSLVGVDDKEIISSLDNLKQLISYKTKETETEYESMEGAVYLKAPKIGFETPETSKAIEVITSLGNAINNAGIEGLMAKNTRVYFTYSLSKSTLANSKGLNLSKEAGGAFLIYAIVFATKGNDNTREYAQKAYKSLSEYSEANVVEEIKKLVEMRLEKQDFENKEYEIVLAPSVFSEVFAEMDGHLNARAVIDKRSVWEDKLNKSVASSILSIVDTPFVPEIGMYKTYDDDGMPTKTLDIIRNGELKTFIHSRATAKIMNTESTGHASGSSVDLNCTYVEKGTTPREELIASTKEGIYITEFKGFHSGLDAASGDFSLEISGNLIVDGKITKAIKTGILSGNVFKDIFNNIKEISNDNDFSKFEWSPTIKLERKIAVTK